jgi:hypothetical protein
MLQLLLRLLCKPYNLPEPPLQRLVQSSVPPASLLRHCAVHQAPFDLSPRLAAAAAHCRLAHQLLCLPLLQQPIALLLHIAAQDQSDTAVAQRA